MRRRETKRPQGQSPKETSQGGSTEERKRAALERIALQIYQLALARRRVQDIIMSDDLASALWMRELTFVHTVLSDVDYLLRSVRSAATQDDED